jgi:hypothetical protein
VLGKPTRKARELTLRHMATLYGLDSANPIFSALRRLWPLQRSRAAAACLGRRTGARPAVAWYAVLHVCQADRWRTVVHREAVETVSKGRKYPERFSPASLKSFAQNVAATWTAAGLPPRACRVRPAPWSSLTLNPSRCCCSGLPGRAHRAASIFVRLDESAWGLTG